MLNLNFLGREDLRKSKLFDATYFKDEFLESKPFLNIVPSDVAYLTIKSLWNLPISALFDARYYQDSYSDLSDLESPAILHYIRHGFAEGRSPSPLVDIDYIIEQLDPSLINTSKALENSSKQELLSQYDGIYSLLSETGASPCPLFMNQYFLENVDFDIGTSIPINIYFKYKGRHPQTGEYLEVNPFISLEKYMAQNPDIKIAEVNPLGHIVSYGHREGRLDQFFSKEFLENTSQLHNSESLKKPIVFITESIRKGIIGGPKWPTPFLYKSMPSLKHQKPENTKSDVLIGCVFYNNCNEELEKLRASIDKQHADNPGLTFSEKYFVNDIDNVERYINFFGEEHLITSDEGNIGFGRAHNVLMNECFKERDLYIGINPDGYLLPGFVKALVNFNDYFKGMALIQAITSPLDHPKWYDPITLDCNWVSGAAFAMSREIWRGIGGFDPEIMMYCEDIDLSWRARINGYWLKVCPNAKFFHDVTGRHLIDADPGEKRVRTRMMLEGAYYLCKKWGGKEMAENLKRQLSIEEYINSISELPTSKTTIPYSVSKEVTDFKNHLRFSPSRFW